MAVQRVLVTGGGTGGHIFPALAIAGELRRQAPRMEVRFAGSRYGMERRIVPGRGFRLHLLHVKGLRGKGLLDTVHSLALLPLALAEALAILLSFQPQAVVGVGGYASFPVALAGKLLGRPLLVQEQNWAPGFANRVLGRLARTVAVSFPQSADAFGPGKTVLTGNPVRPDFAAIGPPDRAAPPGLLIFGGSRGARTINRAVCAALPALAGTGVEMRIRHQTGAEDERWVAEAYRHAGVEAEVSAFIEEMPAAMAECSLALCRSGASTVAELAAAGRPAVFVPFPQATGGHQEQNAFAVAQAGAGLVIPQEKLDPGGLAETLAALLADRGRLDRMAEAAKSLARPDAAAKIAGLVLGMIGGRPRD
jgi:UDP-N-acetylglucosamine--N-acetylmuramyl-(pentapeptide) pyrophosphoryl-undecaprenol N-acetylglucosamine transferase